MQAAATTVETSLWVGPAVTAAIVSGLVALASLATNTLITLNSNDRRLKAERKALERRGELDLQLAEKRMRLDRHLALSRRRAEVAEAVLGDFYEMARIFEQVRSPMIWAGEMEAEEGVPEAVTKNSGYGVIRRLRKHEEFFARLEARRFTAAALFGPEVREHYQAAIRLFNAIYNAGRYILDVKDGDQDAEQRSYLVEQRRVAFATGEDDPTTRKINELVMAVEKVCRPYLEADAPD
jgi:hypothetical protein